MSDNGHVSLDAMSSEFIAEIKDDLASLEPDLLAMEEKGANVDEDLINHAFRSIHSIKGGAGFIDYKILSDLSHVMENVLMQVREKKLAINSSIVDALLSGFDKMKLMADLIGTDTTCDYEKEKAALEQVLLNKDADIKKTGSKSKAPVPELPEEKIEYEQVNPVGESLYFKGQTFLLDKKRLENALDSQKFIYAVFIRYKTDLDLRKKNADSMIDDIKSIGDILYSSLKAAEQTQEKDGFYCVISTILDLPLLSQVLEIHVSQMTLVDKQFTDCETILLKGAASKLVSDGRQILPRTKEPTTFIAPYESSENSPIQANTGSFQSAQTLRINVDLISKLMNRAGELVLSRNQLRSFMEIAAKDNTRAAHMMQSLDMVTTDIQEAIMRMRMQPVIDLLGKYKRVVRDIARRMSKKVDFVLEGADVEVDRNVLEKLANPVTHLIRNCIDHGIETPRERLRMGKLETGTIRIKAFHQGGHVHIIISDDGAGIDPQLVLSKAFEKGLVAEDQIDKLTDKQKVDLIFLPGFSTSQEITDISGRGVGMDVVKTNISRLRGVIEIESVQGEGTTVHLIIPLTLAIVPSLIVRTGESKFAIPQANIKEAIYLEPGKIHEQVGNVAGYEVLRLRDQLIPILRLRNILGLQTFVQPPGSKEPLEEKRKAIADRRQTSPPEQQTDQRSQNSDRRENVWDSTYVIVLKLGANVFGLCVDEIYDIEEVVVEPLNECIKHLKCFAGATILGDGDVIMILDVPGIASVADLKFDSIKNAKLKQDKKELKKTEKKGEIKDLIIFCNAQKEYFALELKSVARLEPIRPADIHFTDKLKYVEYNRQAVLLFSLEEFLPAVPCDLSADQVFAIFPKNISSKVGVLASRIIDTIQTDEILSKDAACSELVLGKLFVNDMMVQVLDQKKLAKAIEHKTVAKKERR